MADAAKPALIDSHNHIDMPAFDGDRDAVVGRARAAGVTDMLVVGGVDEAEGHRRALRVAESLGLPASAGIHPHEAKLADAPRQMRGLTDARMGWRPAPPWGEAQ